MEHTIYKSEEFNMKIQIYSEDSKTKRIENIVQLSLKELQDDVCPNDGISDIIIDDSLSYATEEEFNNCLLFSCSKLRIGGSLTIRDIDIDVICRDTFMKKIDSNNFNGIIKNRKYIHSLHDVKKFMLSKNLILETCTIKNGQYTLIFTKP